MKESRFLKITDLMRPVFEKLGVNYAVMRHVLAVKLLMDARRMPIVLASGRQKKKKDSNLFLKSLWVYALVGLFVVPFIFLSSDYLFKTSLIFAIILFMVMTAMIADFSSVLLDTRDQAILWTKPIDARTLHAAKTVHLCIYLILLTGALGLPAAIAGLMRFGLGFFLLFLLNLIFIDLISLSCTTFVYLLVLKFFDGERLKDIINYVQIFLSLAVAVGYQFVIRAFDVTATHITLTPAWWQLFVPPLWLASTIEWVIGGQRTAFLSLLALLGLLMPFILFSIYQRFSNAFEQAVIKLTVQAGKSRTQSGKLNHLLGKLLCRNLEERTFFRFSSLMMKQDRTFKLKVYPSLGMALVFPFIFLINNFHGSSWHQIGQGSGFFYAYFSLLVIPTALMMLRCSSTFKGAWIYGAAPIKQRHSIFSGALKAMITQLYLPAYFLLSVVFLLLFRWTIIPDLIAILLTASIFTIICSHYCLGESFPFSEPFDAQPSTGNFMVLFLFLIAGLFAAAHAIVRAILPGYGVFIYIACLLAANLLVWKTGLRGKD
ncbi:hypothetical protein [Sporolactobacillus terrae]|uniref:hypothetical protein n=1 Tax=Sporolactobacillus terrae TaxID=269673 RepID=UPI001CBF4B82|nr:hypothetical protein [Sporolactobacillus terrae]UAK15801.1 hypothetical protein K7399_12400 [Sporolactobacillus terrae]